MGWHRDAFAYTSPIFGEIVETIPTIRGAVMTASMRGLTPCEAVRRAVINNKYTSARSYLKAAKQSYVHKLPTVTQSSPLRNESYFISLAFPEGVPTITNTEYNTPTAIQLLDSLQSPIGTYDTSVHSFTYTEYGATLTKAYTAAAIIDDTTFSYVETVRNSSNTVISTTNKVGIRPAGYNTKVLIYTYLHLGLPKIKLYHPAVKDANLFHDIFSTYANATDFVAYPIYPLMLDGVYIDAASRKEEYDDASRLLDTIAFPFKKVFEAMKEGVPTDVGDEDNAITDIFLLNAVNINTGTQAGKAYLFEFFDAIYLNHLDPGTGAVNWTATNYSVNISESDYNFQLNFNGIANTVVSGYSTSYESTVAAGGTITLTAPSAYGENTYRRLVITGISASTTVDYPSGRRQSVAIAVSTDPASLDYDNFCIPLIHGVLANLPLLHYKEQIFSESFVVVSHSLYEFYLKWYQELWGKIKRLVILAIFVLITLYFTAVDGGFTATAFYAAFIQAVVVTFVLEQVMVAIDDPWLRAAVQLAIIVVTANPEGGFNPDTFSLSNPVNLINAVSAVGTAYQAQQMEELSDELQDFLKTSAEQWKELEEQRELLEEPDYSDLMLSANLSNINTYEEPSTFYARTLNTNPGVLVYDQIRDYFDTKLTLPQLSPLA